MPVCVQENRDFRRVKLENKVGFVITLLKIFPEISDFSGFWFLALRSLCLFLRGLKHPIPLFPFSMILPY